MSNAFVFEHEYQQTGPYDFRLALDFSLIRDTILLLRSSLYLRSLTRGIVTGLFFNAFGALLSVEVW